MNQATAKGVFTISLDFELYWGVRDKKTLDSYRANLLGVRAAVPAMLEAFHRCEIHATWATVGFLFFASREELVKGLPARKPQYVNRNLSPYENLDGLGRDEASDPFHFAPSLIDLIRSHAHQEIASHTFSHYYCLEKGQDRNAFEDDLGAAAQAAAQHQVKLESLVFPRNQFQEDYLALCRDAGFKAYRGNEASWIYRARNQENESTARRAVRLLDAYLNISGHNGTAWSRLRGAYPLDIPSSRFLRPYSRRLKSLEPLRLRRILADLEYAARHGLIYHLWWHPHNFGVNLEENMAFLGKILDAYARLRRKHGMQSLNMGEIARQAGVTATPSNQS